MRTKRTNINRKIKNWGTSPGAYSWIFPSILSRDVSRPIARAEKYLMDYKSLYLQQPGLHMQG